MAIPVLIEKVVEEIDNSIEGYGCFINRRTGELVGGDVDLIDEEDGAEALPA